MLFTTFAQYLAKLDSVSSRLEITAILAQVYGEFSSAERRLGSYLLQGSLVPEYESMEFQLSTKMILRSLSQLRGLDAKNSPQPVEQDTLFGESGSDEGIGKKDAVVSQDLQWVQQQFRQAGDLGEVARLVREAMVEKGAVGALPIHEPTVESVYQSLFAIAQAGGHGSQEQKVELLVDLLRRVDPIAAKYIVRIILDKLRLGFSTMTILDALSWVAHADKRDHAVLEEAYQKRADIGALAQVYLDAPDESARNNALAAYSVVAGVPVVPQLCQRLASPTEVIEKLKEVYVEPKYDGLRAQIHIFTDLETGKKNIRIFTRSLEEVTHMFPEAEQLLSEIKADNVVLDGEAIGYNKATDALLPFQETITRKRKHNVAATADKTPIRFFVYDVLSLAGKSLIDTPLHERKEVLRTLFADSQLLRQPEYIVTTDPIQLQHFHEQQLADGLEGVVIKQVDSPYQSGRKGWYWVKLKELAGTRGKLSDTLDCVVMGYYFGQGKRTAFGVGAFLVGVRDGEKIKTIAKIGTGLTDEQFRELKTRADVLHVDSQPEVYDVPKTLLPPVWLRPELVVEIAADEITNSPTHTAGVALRFPRLVKFRDDKTVEQSTSVEELSGIVL